MSTTHLAINLESIHILIRRLGLALGPILCLAVLVSTLSARERTAPGADPAQGVGDSREAMWPAPTAEDWKKPCQITFQRTWEDALAVSRETGKAILVCVNMDGEIASEHYAGIRYRDPEIAKLYEPYVCVIASVYRHNPRDFDEQGRRILCPRFGSVTCGEHIAIEPGLYQEFFDGRRIAPRHVGVELDGMEMYDVYYAFDTDSVFNAIREGITNRPDTPPTVVRGDRPILERVASRDIRDRIAVEAAYENGDGELRRSLLEAALEHSEAEPVDLLRQAVFGFDTSLSQLARRTLAECESRGAVELITEALRVPLDEGERDDLIAALARIGETSPRSRMLAVVHKGLSSRSSVVNVEGWSQAFEARTVGAGEVGTTGTASTGATASQGASEEVSTTESWLARQAEVLASDDAMAHVELAEAFLAFAEEQPETEAEFARSLILDARQTALAAEELGAYGWRVNAVVALTAKALGGSEEAHARAEAAVSTMPPGEAGRNAVGVLGIFAEARRQTIARAVREKRDWQSWSRAFEGTGQWLTDLHAAYSVLERHPLGNDEHVMSHYDYLRLLGAAGQASRVLDEGLARFPDSPILHDRLRGRILREKGPGGLEAYYEARLREQDVPQNLEWYAGYASIVAAEFHRRRGHEAEAIAAYDRGIAHYERNVASNPESRETADHFVALALAGRARVALEREDFENAVKEIQASFARNPSAAASLDGLGISPVDTAKMLLARLQERKLGGLATTVEAELGKLDPELLRLPAYERELPPRAFRGRPGERGQRGERGPRRRRAGGEGSESGGE